MKKKWWHDKTAYQIYPKSFMDSNGDGIGDLRGVINKLDYLKELGVDIVWLSPIYRSPLADQGYDISDYYDIDPRFGTMDDMDELISEAKKRDMYIVMDLVVNHCSDEHEWFKKACEDPDGPYGKFFYIKDYKEGDKLPCNWRSYFGGPCWDKLPGHDDKIYLHVFHKKQPDLNWENPELRKEIYKMINWWLDKGLGGFRIDAIINIKKKLPFSDYPVDREDGLSGIFNMLAEATGIGEFLGEMARETFQKYDAFAVGEVFNEKDEEIPLFIGEDGYFSSMFDFAEAILGGSFNGWYDAKPVTAEQYKEAIFRAHRRVDGIGFLSNIIENHDEPRGVSHYIPKEDLCDASKKLLGGVNFLMPGLPFIYQGQEIGMENYSKFDSIDDIDDCSTKDEYQVALDAGLTPDEALKAVSMRSRDNARSPFQWNDKENAGFTTGTPWLKVNPNYSDINLAKQHDDELSVWNFYRSLIRLRKSPEYSNTIIYGSFEPYKEEQHNLLAYRRVADKDILIIANFQTDSQTVQLPCEIKKVLINNLTDVKQNGCNLLLDGYQFIVVEL